MSQTAEVIKFEKPYVKADIDNGFDRIAGELTNALANPPVKLSPREYQVIHAVISKTYRFHKKSDWIASCQLSELTGIDESNISRVKRSLINKKVLVVDGRNLAINPVISEWVESKKEAKNRQKRRESKPSETTSGSSKMTKEPSETTNQTVRNDCNNRKTIRQKTTKQKTKGFSPEKVELPDFLPTQNWLEFVQHRKDIKKPLSELATTKLLNQIVKDYENGLDVIAAMDASIANRWTGIFAKPAQGQNNHRGAFPTRQEQRSQRNMQACQEFIGGFDDE